MKYSNIKQTNKGTKSTQSHMFGYHIYIIGCNAWLTKMHVKQPIIVSIRNMFMYKI